MKLTIVNLDESGDVYAICSITSDDPVHGFIACEYKLKGTVNLNLGSIDLTADRWINKGGFEYKRDFYGAINQEMTEINGTSQDHDSGDNPSSWEMSVVK